ncbi:MAG: hypothetical protein U0Q12_02190 [Vicinamibacterales bacterium]
MTVRSALLVLGTTLVAAGCGGTTAAVTAPTTSPVTETFASILTPQGAATRIFGTSVAGTLRVTLTSAGPPSTVVGLGLGIRDTSGQACQLTSAVNTTAGTSAQLSAAADAGTYCVRIYDVTGLPEPINFSITIVHP